MFIYVGGLLGYLVILFIFILLFRKIWEKFLQPWLTEEKQVPVADDEVEEEKQSRR